MTTEAEIQAAFAAHGRDMAEIERQGYDRFGNEFDAMCNRVVDKLGGKQNNAHLALGSVIKNFDDPVAIIEHLDNNPARLESIMKMPAQAQLVEIARIEAQHSSHGRRASGAGPAWASPSNTSRPSNAQWRQSYGSELTDEAWNREFDRRQRERAELRRTRGY